MYNILNHQENRAELNFHVILNDFQYQYQAFVLLNEDHKIVADAVVVQKNDDDKKLIHLLNQIHHLRKTKNNNFINYKIKNNQTWMKRNITSNTCKTIQMKNKLFGTKNNFILSYHCMTSCTN